MVDTLGGNWQRRAWEVVAPGGALVSVVGPAEDSAGAGRRGGSVVVAIHPRNGEQLAAFARLLAAGAIRVVHEPASVAADGAPAFTLADAPAALALVAAGRARGKVVLGVA